MPIIKSNLYFPNGNVNLVNISILEIFNLPYHYSLNESDFIQELQNFKG